MSRTTSAAKGAVRQATAHQILFWWLCSWRKACACLTLQSFLNAEGSNSGKEVFGAWMVMVEVSAQDPAAPSWEFLQVCCPHPDKTDYNSVTACVYLQC